VARQSTTKGEISMEIAWFLFGMSLGVALGGAITGLIGLMK